MEFPLKIITLAIFLTPEMRSWFQTDSTIMLRLFHKNQFPLLLLQSNSHSSTHSISFCCCCCWVASVVSNSVQPHWLQPTRLLCPWDSPGKNTGVGCHFLLQCMKVKSEREVTQSCPISDPMGCSPPGSSIHGIFQARVLEWGVHVMN